MKKLLAFVCSTVVLFCTEMSYAMPSQAELDNVQPLVNELMGPLVKDFKAKKKLAVEVGDGAVELVAEANSDAAKFVLLKGAVFYYARAKAYDKAADTIESIMELVPDIPPKALYEITSKAAASATVKNAPRLVALNKSAQKRATVASRLASVKKQLRATPADLKLIRQHAELLAAMGKWETALAEFAKLGGEIGKMATADAAATGNGTELADFWWNYTPTAPEAKDAIREHAASLYQKTLDNGELDGLKRTLAERRIAEVAESNPQAVASKIDYKFNYRLDDKGNAILQGTPCVSPKPVGAFVVPDIIDGHKVTGIHGNFRKCDQMTSLTLPAHLESLPGWRGQIDCSICDFAPMLRDIRISNRNPHYKSVGGALYSKDGKILLAYPKARNEIKILPGTEKISVAACRTCNQATYVKVPDGVEDVQGFAFALCEKLEVVEFPSSLKRIDTYSFGSSPHMQKVIFHGDAPQAHPSIFSNASNDLVVEVERGSKGWAGPGKTDLPERWPLQGDSRTIRYITK